MAPARRPQHAWRASGAVLIGGPVDMAALVHRGREELSACG